MNTRFSLIALLALPLMLAACGNHDNPVLYDDIAPLPPVGIRTVSLDHAVELQWIDNQEPDLAGYNIYVSTSFKGRYDRIGSSTRPVFTDGGARNGMTYYYAVTAYDFNGNESALSRDVVYDTPRPEGRNVTLIDRFADPLRAGYDFSEYLRVHYDTDLTDVYFEMGNGIPLLRVWDDSDIQDLGFTRNLDEISVAPEDGWLPSGTAEAAVGHTYVIWTYDNHFAKVRVTSMGPGTVTFDWAYQTATGNPELARGERGTMSKTAQRMRTGTRHAQQ